MGDEQPQDSKRARRLDEAEAQRKEGFCFPRGEIEEEREGRCIRRVEIDQIDCCVEGRPEEVHVKREPGSLASDKAHPVESSCRRSSAVLRSWYAAARVWWIDFMWKRFF
jgi:hypothetical protein